MSEILFSMNNSFHLLRENFFPFFQERAAVLSASPLSRDFISYHNKAINVEFNAEFTLFKVPFLVSYSGSVTNIIDFLLLMSHRIINNTNCLLFKS